MCLRGPPCRTRRARSCGSARKCRFSCGPLRLGAAVIDVLDRQVDLVSVLLRCLAIFGAAIGGDEADPDPVLVEKTASTRSFSRSAAVIGVLRSYSLPKRHLRIGVDDRLPEKEPINGQIVSALSSSALCSGTRDVMARSIRASFDRGLFVSVGMLRDIVQLDEQYRNHGLALFMPLRFMKP